MFANYAQKTSRYTFCSCIVNVRVCSVHDVDVCHRIDTLGHLGKQQEAFKICRFMKPLRQRHIKFTFLTSRCIILYYWGHLANTGFDRHELEL